MDEGKICNKCGRLLPIENFRLCKGQFGNPYYRGYCKSCEVEYGREYKEKKREKEFTFSDDFEIIAKRKFKDIHKEITIRYLSTSYLFYSNNYIRFLCSDSGTKSYIIACDNACVDYVTSIY